MSSITSYKEPSSTEIRAPSNAIKDLRSSLLTEIFSCLAWEEMLKSKETSPQWKAEVLSAARINTFLHTLPRSLSTPRLDYLPQTALPAQDPSQASDALLLFNKASHLSLDPLHKRHTLSLIIYYQALINIEQAIAILQMLPNNDSQIDIVSYLLENPEKFSDFTTIRRLLRAIPEEDVRFAAYGVSLSLSVMQTIDYIAKFFGQPRHSLLLR